MTPRRPRGPTLIAAGLSFAAGAGLFHLTPWMPPLWWGAAGVAVAALATWRRERARLVLWLLLGLFWAQLRACLILCAPFPDQLARAPLIVEGRVASLPAETDLGRRFLLAVEKTWRDGEPLPFRGLVRLTWYDDAPELRAGERWRLPVRLKPRHGLANPGVFDFERWLFEQGVKATGSVRRGDPALRLDAGAGPYVLGRWRQRIAQDLDRGLADDASAAALVRALVIGERSGFSPRDWEVLTRTGTNHLVAISGLHVGLIAGGVFLLVRWLWSLSQRLTGALAAPRAAALAGMLAALGYAGLAGFAVSTQRALMMVAVVLAALYWQRTLRPYHALVLALAGVLLIDPGAVLSAGFWLSFAAVAVLVLGFAHRLPSRDVWTRWGRAQWLVAIGLFPLLLLLFGRASLIAPVVNLLAVPLFSLILLPLVLASSLLSVIAGFDLPLRWTAVLLAWCMDGLGWLSDRPWAAAAFAQRPIWAWPAAFLGALLLLAPRGLPGRWLGALLLLPVLLLRPPEPVHGEVWFTLLDVGLGLAAVIRTQEGTLVYDTGPGYPGGFNTGSAVVAPFLAAQGVRRVERLVISHADRDHAGGLPGLAAQVSIGRIQSGEPEGLGVPGAEACRAGERWEWSGVSFRFLHPAGTGLSGNDASCVLRVEAGGRSILLTGDIQSGTERRLARALGDEIASDILVAGHHGSATSTHPEFLDAVSPRLVLFASGYANQFGFPVPEVRERVALRGVPALDTGLVGAVEVRLDPEGAMSGPWGWRRRAGRFWTHRPEGWPSP